MRRSRFIPILGIQERKLVKTVKYKKPNYLGDPINAVKIFNEKQVDELAIVDIRASLNHKEPDYKFIYQMAGEAFMPISYGGGIDTFEKAKNIFECGVEKIIVNSAFFENPDLADKIAETYGNQCMVISLDVSVNWLSKQIITTLSGTKSISLKLNDVIELIAKSNAGEVLLNDITRDGTFVGYNLELIKYVSSRLKIPIIANCGANSLTDMQKGIEAGASAVAASSIFVYKNNNTSSILINYPKFDESFR